jgi:uncharacterized protein YndB with AHSA1/START domain
MVAMASSATATVTLPSDTQILIRREFDALRELVYRAWTTPELIERWWSGDRGPSPVPRSIFGSGGPGAT